MIFGRPRTTVEAFAEASYGTNFTVHFMQGDVPTEGEGKSMEETFRDEDRLALKEIRINEAGVLDTSLDNTFTPEVSGTCTWVKIIRTNIVENIGKYPIITTDELSDADNQFMQIDNMVMDVDVVNEILVMNIGVE